MLKATLRDKDGNVIQTWTTTSQEKAEEALRNREPGHTVTTEPLEDDEIR